MPDLTEIRTFIQSNTVSATTGRKCVDGRYLPDQAYGMIARPGGDAGYVLALLAVNDQQQLGITPVECFNLVYEAVKTEGGFFMHTDQSASGLIGCGHLAKAANAALAPAYGVDPKQVISFINHARNSDVHMIHLVGVHKEQGVIVVKDTNKTVLSLHPDNNQMYFIYDEERDNDFLKKLVSRIDRVGVTYEAVKAASDRQLQATLKNLALGLSIYAVSYKDNEPQVSFVTGVS